MIRLGLALACAQVGFHAFVASLPIALVGAGRDNGEIGAIMGSASLVPLVAALAAGGLIDRFGGGRVFLLGAGSFLAAAALMATGLVSPSSSTAALLLVRVLQGLGLAAVLPASFTLIPNLVAPARLGTAIGVVGVGANVSLAISPPVSLAILDRVSFPAVAALAAAVVALSIVLIWPLMHLGATARNSRLDAEPVRRGVLGSLRPAWRSAWLPPLLVALLFVAHWGVVTGYLPQRAEGAGADVGLFFSADAVALLLLRIPTGYLADRVGARWLIVAGVVVTVAALALLLPGPTTLLLVLSGLGTGAGAALILPPINLALTHRSGEADRGSAFALYNVAFSAGVAIGSIGVAPVIGIIGFETALAVGIATCAVAALVAILDRTPAHVAAPQPAGSP